MTEEKSKPIYLNEIDVSKCNDFHYGECLNLVETVSACKNCLNCSFKQSAYKQLSEVIDDK